MGAGQFLQGIIPSEKRSVVDLDLGEKISFVDLDLGKKRSLAENALVFRSISSSALVYLTTICE